MQGQHCTLNLRMCWEKKISLLLNFLVLPVQHFTNLWVPTPANLSICLANNVFAKSSTITHFFYFFYKQNIFQKPCPALHSTLWNLRTVLYFDGLGFSCLHRGLATGMCTIQCCAVWFLSVVHSGAVLSVVQCSVVQWCVLKWWALLWNVFK